ncbi:hypothetical protein BU23DRAFT_571588 [Bimuria novae-zelandiae CBS 107.79]|uniref:Uncharacterized protein n=1 Tax=Bimuria novae-zelandiae CBS 107.79 TaxID=1447943 RepID=A0A6A5UZX6_9PLEO|nr:hypothetical protein BU23DRAFT_571588 [Bimuria novae-zelandiae CBS 107.79]
MQSKSPEEKFNDRKPETRRQEDNQDSEVENTRVGLAETIIPDTSRIHLAQGNSLSSRRAGKHPEIASSAPTGLSQWYEVAERPFGESFQDQRTAYEQLKDIPDDYNDQKRGESSKEAAKPYRDDTYVNRHSPSSARLPVPLNTTKPKSRSEPTNFVEDGDSLEAFVANINLNTHTDMLISTISRMKESESLLYHGGKIDAYRAAHGIFLLALCYAEEERRRLAKNINDNADKGQARQHTFFGL